MPVCANDSIISVNQGPKTNENAQFELAVIGILYRSHARSELTPTLKVILAILTNLCRRSRNGIISYQTSELFQRCFYLFNESQIRRHLSTLESKELIQVRYTQSERYIKVPAIESSEKFLTIFKVVDDFDLSFSDLLVFSYIIDKTSVFAKAGLGFFTDNSGISPIQANLNISNRTIRNSFNTLLEKGFIRYSTDRKSIFTVKSVELDPSIANSYAQIFKLTESDDCKKLIDKRIASIAKDDRDVQSLSSDEKKNIILSRVQKVGKKRSSKNKISDNLGKKRSSNCMVEADLGKKCTSTSSEDLLKSDFSKNESFPQVENSQDFYLGKKSNFPQVILEKNDHILEKNDHAIYKVFNDLNNDPFNNDSDQLVAEANSYTQKCNGIYLNSTEPLGINLDYSHKLSDAGISVLRVKPNSPADILGIKQLDCIINVNGISMLNQTASSASFLFKQQRICMLIRRVDGSTKLFTFIRSKDFD